MLRGVNESNCRNAAVLLTQIKRSLLIKLIKSSKKDKIVTSSVLKGKVRSICGQKS